MLAIGEPAYWVARAKDEALDTGAWDDDFWREAHVAEVEEFAGPGSDHRPTTEVKLLYGNTGVHGLFRVRDRYVLSTRTEFQAPVYRDACVEFFFKPSGDPSKGYFNFEMNCGGALLSSYIEDPARTATGFEKFTPLSAEQGARVRVRGSMGKRVEPEMVEPVTWTLQFFAPFALLEEFTGPLESMRGRVCRGNFFKCSEDNSHPHWASWAPLGERFDFHQPDWFGWLVFE